MMMPDDIEHCLMQNAIGSEQAVLVKRQFGSAGGRHLASRFLNKQSAAPEVPGRELILEEGSVVTAPHMTQIECGCSKASNSMHLLTKDVGNCGERGFH